MTFKSKNQLEGIFYLKQKTIFWFYSCLLLSSNTLAGPAAVANYKSTTRLKVDESCDQNFVSAYYAKKNCLLQNDQEQCVRASVLNKFVVAGTGLGAFGEKIFDSYLNRNLKVKDNFLKVVDQTHRVITAKGQAAQKYFALQKEIANKITNNQFNSVDEIFDKMEQSGNRDKLLRLAHDIEKAASLEMEKLIEQESDIYKKTALRELMGLPTDNFFTKEGMKVISEAFPKEYKVLNPVYLNDEIKSEYKNIANPSESLKLVDTLLKSNLAFQSFLPERKSVFEQAKKAISRENIVNGAKTVGRVARGAGEGFLVSAALSTTGSYVKQGYLNHYLNLCKGRLGLSESETKYLSEYHLFGDQNIVYSGPESLNLDCYKIGFNISEAAIADTGEKFGGIPSGICKMMKKESDSIDKLFEADNSKIDCNKNDQIKPVQNGPFMVDTFISKGPELSYDSVASWPYSRIGKDKIDGDSDQSFSCTVSPLKSKDENSTCAQKQIISCYNKKSRSCSLVAEAAKARVALAITHNLCPSGARSWEGKIQEKTLPAVK